MGVDDLVFYKGEGGNIMSMGFNIESQLMTTNNSNKIGGQVSSLFKNLAIPSGYSYNKAYGSSNKTSTKLINNDEILSEDIHDKLLKFVVVNSKTNKTRKSNKSHNKKTKKSKLFLAK